MVPATKRGKIFWSRRMGSDQRDRANSATTAFCHDLGPGGSAGRVVMVTD
jgi:hypothetical protein